jgi:hypothetical protein
LTPIWSERGYFGSSVPTGSFTRNVQSLKVNAWQRVRVRQPDAPSKLG